MEINGTRQDDYSQQSFFLNLPFKETNASEVPKTSTPGTLPK